jgi:assimilatory nitrate reductase catalytic subunit
VHQGQHAAPDGQRRRHAQTRALLQPMRAPHAASRPAVSWDAALDEAGQRFARIIVQQHGPDAVGFYLSGQLLTEDYYVFNKLAKGLIGTNNVDTNSRLCMSSAVAGYKATLGADAPPACYDDIGHAQTCSSPAPTWPGRTRCCSAGWKTRAAPTRRRSWIVVDPRRTETAEMPTCTCSCCPAPTWRCSTACCT